MLRMTTALLLICFVAESRAQDNARMATGKHSLIATFDEKDARRNFFHDVNVCSESERLTLVVLDDIAKKEDKAEKADSKPAKGGFGDPSEDGTSQVACPTIGTRALAFPGAKSPWNRRCRGSDSFRRHHNS